MFLFQVLFGIVGVAVRLPRRLLLGLVLFVLAFVLLELVHPSPRSAPPRAAVTRVSATSMARATQSTP